MDRAKAARMLWRSIAALLVAYILWALAYYDFSPRALKRNARIAASALKQKYLFFYHYYTEPEKYASYVDMWFRTGRKAAGVTRIDEGKVSPGTVFFTNQEARAFLVDNEGNVLHEWGLPFPDAWPNPSHVRTFEPDKLMYWRMARLMPNGDVIAIYEGLFQEPYGAGLVKVDRDSNLIWKLDINAHHDLDLDADGNIYVLKHVYMYDGELGIPVIRDGIAIISPDGRVIREVDLMDRLRNSEFSELIDWSHPDPLHTNNLEILDEEMAVHFPMFRAGDILVSMNVPSAVFVLDGENLEPKWGLWGMTWLQHDPDFLDNGNILLFDNDADKDGPGSGSRVIEVNPSDKSIAWEYSGTADDPLSSVNRGSQQRLGNGNTLITSSTQGRLLEVTPTGEVVWEYINPSLEGESIGILNWAVRYNREELEFIE